jgi:hypothetical protein
MVSLRATIVRLSDESWVVDIDWAERYSYEVPAHAEIGAIDAEEAASIRAWRDLPRLLPGQQGRDDLH